jgi:hypothetical protein
MTARSIRRAAERKALKLARKAARDQQPTSSAVPPAPAQAEEAPAISPNRLAANRANARLSTGPRSEEGKRTSSLNAVKTALTGATVLLSTDDAADYQRHIAAYEKELQPVGLEESELVQSLADISWRLRRIPALEMAIYAQGRIEFADQFEDQQARQPSGAWSTQSRNRQAPAKALPGDYLRDPDVRRSLIELHTHLVYEKQLRNLQLQEARLVRRREKETAALRRLQEERKQHERQTPQNIVSTGSIGFEFSIADGKAEMDGPRVAFDPGARSHSAIVSTHTQTASRAA